MNSPWHPWALALFLGTGCAAPAAAPRKPAPRPPALAVDPGKPLESAVLESLPAPEEPAEALLQDSILGWSAGQSLNVEQLLLEWHATDPNSLWLVLEKLVTARLAAAEAERISFSLAPETLALRFEEEQRRLEQVLRQERLSLSDYAREEYGQSPEVFMGSLRGAVARQMLIERVTRAWVLSNPWLRLRMIVVQGPEAMASLQARLAGGEDFASLAQELSQDGSAAQGGLVPFLVREEESPLSRRAFTQDLGEIGTPFLHKGLQVLVRVEEKHSPAPRDDWKSLEAAVEASLLEFSLSDTEFGHWKLNMEQRYPIDVRPLLDLLGVENSG